MSSSPTPQALDRARDFLERLRAHPEEPPKPGEVERLLAQLGLPAPRKAAAEDEGVEERREEPRARTAAKRS